MALTAELAWSAAMACRLELADRAVASLAAQCDPARPTHWTWLHQARFAVSLARRDRGRALAEIRAARAASERSGSELSVVLDLAGEATTAALGGTAPGQGPSIEEALEAARRCGSRWAEHCALLGLAARERRSGGPALAARLRDAFGQARETGYGNPIYLLREEVADLCAAALELGIEPECVRAYVAVNRLAPPAWAHELVGWPWALSARVLGRLDVECGGRRLEGPAEGNRALELLALLVALGGSDVDGEQVAAALWPDSEGDAARHALETALYRLRKTLGDPELVLQSRGLVSLDPARCWTDLGALDRQLTRLERASLAPPGSGDEDLSRMATAALEVRGEPVPS